MTYEELVKWIFSLPHERPVSYDGDIFCPRCGEPWDGQGLSLEMPREDVERFLRGEGCPCCKWGKIETP